MILDEILAHKRREVAERRSRRPLDVLEAAISLSRSDTRAAPLQTGNALRHLEIGSCADKAVAPAHSFSSALRQPGVSVIAEFKRRSPSGGELRPGASAAEIARIYLDNGAAALSILTEAELRDLLARTHSLNMEALVETHSADEVRTALNAGAQLIGVNNRDLDTLQTDVSLAPRLRPLVPAESVFVAESGVSTPEQIARLLEVGADAVLVGESLLRAADPGEQLRRLVVAGAPRGIHA